MRQFSALLRKDLIQELRARETAVSMISLAIMISVLCAVGVQGAFLEHKAVERIFPSFLWIGFVFAGTISISRSLHYEFELRGIDGALTAGASPGAIYGSKVIVNGLVAWIMFSLLSLLLSGLLNLDAFEVATSLVPIGGIVSVGYAALSTLFASMTIHAKLRDLLLPLILIPLIFPLFFSGYELTMALLMQSFSWSSPWVTLLVILDLIYVVSGAVLFEHAVRG